MRSAFAINSQIEHREIGLYLGFASAAIVGTSVGVTVPQK
jgi:hypothetical protein